MSEGGVDVRLLISKCGGVSGCPFPPAYDAKMLDGLTPQEAAVLEPPYHPRLDRPALTLKGEVAGQKRADWKKEHDGKVFGYSKYF